MHELSRTSWLDTAKNQGLNDNTAMGKHKYQTSSVCEYKPLASRRFWGERTCGSVTLYVYTSRRLCFLPSRCGVSPDADYVSVMRKFRRSNAPKQRTQFLLLSTSITFLRSRCYSGRQGRFKLLTRCRWSRNAHWSGMKSYYPTFAAPN
jgi:hypothetical protein